jgi:hypothetical protein
LCDGFEAGEPAGIVADVLREYLAADANAATRRRWLRAFGRLQVDMSTEA